MANHRLVFALLFFAGLSAQGHSETQHVAFSVTVDDDFGPFTSAEIVIWDREITNVGNAYNPHTGIFTAPISGI